MGWFDEDDDSEEEQTTAKKQSNQAAGEDEDTLDAFMKTLDANATHRAPRAERLDVENADEATSHWTECAVEKRTSEEDEEDDPTRASQQALESMFHKAGAAANDEENGPRRDYTDEIQLEQVEHDKMDYEDFTRVFYKYCDTAAGQEWRRQHHVTCNPQSFDPVTSFDEISDILQGPLRQVISKSNYVTPTPVQAQTLAVALSGRDAIVTASTGSGKTLAYVWPMCVHICHQRHLDKGEGPVAVVLVPTRELCLQVHKQCQIMIGALKGKAVAITGGTNRYQLVQEFAKNGSEIVVATPGRFLDILSIKKNGITLKRVTMVVLDECDRMLDMGFEKQVTQLLKNVRPDRQSLLLSATLGRKVERVARQWLSNPIRVAVGQTGQSSHHVKQHVMVLPSYEEKKLWLKEMIPVLSPVGRTLVFVATKVGCEMLASFLREADPSIRIETLHGDKHSSDRQAALRAFEKGQLSALLATDVASRGLDQDCATVVNFDPPKNLDILVHRIGRAGRLAKDEQGFREGNAYTLLTTKDADFAQVLLNSFEREDRDISLELRRLAQQSRRAGNVDSRDKWNKAGLGYDSEPQPKKRRFVK